MPPLGWKAKGILQPLWREYEGGRDALAETVGTQGSVLSSINSGKRRLGHDLAGRLAEVVGVSLAELGAPEAEATDQESTTLFARLAALEERVDRNSYLTADSLARLEEAVERLSLQRQPASTQSRSPTQ